MSRPKLGQHFLVRGSTLDRIAKAVCSPGEPVVIEIGPGRGALTERLLARAQRVVAIEIDAGLVDELRRRFAAEPRLQVIQGDILETELDQWGPAAIAGNLPYYITSPILERVVLSGAMSRAVLLMQKEVAERLVAAPGRREYGYLTIQIRLFADSELLFEVKPGAFHPPPKVDSAVVRLEPRERAGELGIRKPQEFLRFAGLCFRQKRKPIRNNLCEQYGKELVGAWPEASLRAEQLSLEQFAQMYRRLVP